MLPQGKQCVITGVQQKKKGYSFKTNKKIRESIFTKRCLLSFIGINVSVKAKKGTNILEQRFIFGDFHRAECVSDTRDRICDFTL